MIYNGYRKDVRVRVSGILIEDNKLLLVAHEKKGDIYWLLPGGGVDFGETLEEALKREYKEELGIDVAVGELLLICDSIDPSGGRHILNICFSCTYTGGTYVLGKEKRLYDYAFFDEEELLQRTIYPPFNENLVSLLNNRPGDIYLGSLWLDN